MSTFVDGVEVMSTAVYDLNHCIADDCRDISKNLAARTVAIYTEEAEVMERKDYE